MRPLRGDDEITHLADPTRLGGRYALGQVLGSGTTATVFAADDLHTHEPVAVKVLHPMLALHAQVRERFAREAALMARLSHPHVVAVRDVGTAGNQVYLVMDRVHGQTLKERVQTEGPLRPQVATILLQQVLLALHHAHGLGVAHRDIKPHNVLIDEDGAARVTDFGIARLLTDPGPGGDEADEELTRPGSMLGTPGYMAPEQMQDAAGVDHRCDIFAAGATLYAVLVGTRPGRLDLCGRGDACWTQLPGPLAEVVFRATRPHPADRYATAAGMARALALAHDLLPAEPRGDAEATLIALETIGPEGEADDGIRARQRDFPAAPGVPEVAVPAHPSGRTSRAPALAAGALLTLCVWVGWWVLGG